MHVYIEDIGSSRRRGDHHQGVAAQPPIERQDPLPDPARRHRLHPGGDVEGGGRRGGMFKAADHLSQETSVIVTGTARADARAPERLRDRPQDARGRRRVARLSDHAEGARRRLPARPPPPLDPQRAAAGDSAHPPRDHQRDPRLLQLARLHPGRHADLHAGGVRGHDDAVSGAVLRGSDGLPDAERPAL